LPVIWTVFDSAIGSAIGRAIGSVMDGMMNSAIRKHLVRETLVSTIINSVLSFAITFLVLAGNDIVLRQALVIDALPQTFAVTFFSVFVPTFLTRKKIKSGQLQTLPFRKTWLPNNAFFRAVLCGLLAAIVGGLAHFAVLTGLQIEELMISTVFIYKTLYGAVISILITPVALRIVLHESGKTI
jgi:hypothetical protein